MATKTAKAHPAAWNLECPHCGECIGNPSEDGSHIWLSLPGGTVKCDSCGQTVKVPVRR